ncbi:two-partner secretion domain-containing protein [Coleofasciculus sp. E1-EBD-02]|uniref:two-partner secretion domain-containing protein n=1 Tax=Coleofasciculus sp. E1-EBD-02 TaxID=3068481 RepID=UPI0032F6E5DC
MALMNVNMMSMRLCLVSGLVIKLGVGIFFNPVSAQIIPDATLGSEGSRFIEGVDIDRIEGGAARGVNLFHSFTEFNVLDGQQVYFANPGGIENILSRVTGGNGSTIFGTLGVLGNANLFLVNPNGIVFGPNARLDVAGSFVASTGNGFNFSDGSSFSATNPEAPPLLTINVTPGLQYGASQPQAEIINQGNLRVGQDFTLVGNRLTLSGQLEAGRDLTLLATDTVEIRDSVSNPFIAEAGGELVVQGNQAVDIFALNHPDSGLFSGGDMVLRSANPVGGDAHYWSGGSFRIEQLDSSLGSLSSPNDPVIRASGDVSFDSYTGASLHIFAGGSVTVTGGITINDVDDTNGIQETVTLSDGTTVVEIDGKTKPTLDIRAGTTAFGTPGNPDNVNVNNPPGINGTGTSADITIGGNVTNNNGGTVFLTNQYQPNPALVAGDIKVGDISTSSFSGDGGSITIDARGEITTGNLNSYSSSGNSGNGGDITLSTTNGNITTTGTVYSYSSSNSGNSGNGGDITLSTTNGNITTTGTFFSDSSSQSGNSGNGGNITLSATNDITIGDFLLSYSSSLSGNSGNGGAITLSTTNGKITTTGTFFSDSSSQSGNSGNGGNITLSATNDITIDNFLLSYSYSKSGNSGNGGNITLSATNGNIQIVKINSFGSFSYSEKGDSGGGGSINLSAKEGDILGGDRLFIDSFSVSGQELKSAKNGGDVTIKAQDNVSNLEINTISSSADGGKVKVSGFGDLSLTHTNITTGRDFRSPPDDKNPSIEFQVDKKGSSGNVTVTSTGNLTFNHSRINGDTQGSGSAGNVIIDSPNLVTFNNSSQISSNTSSKGQAGNIQIKGDQVLLDNSTISSAVNSGDAKDAAGTITVEAGTIEMRNDAMVKADSNSTESVPGEITLSATNQISIQNSQVTSDSQNNGSGFGEVKIEATQGSIYLDQATVSSQNTGSAFAGDIFINASDELSIDNSTISADGYFGRIFVGFSSSQDYNDTGIRPQAIAIDNSKLTTTNAVINGAKKAGNILLRATDNTSIENNSSLSTFTVDSAQGGDIEIKTGSLSLTNSQLNATTSGTGRAGDVIVNASESVEINGTLTEGENKGRGGILTEATDDGNAGGVTINTQQLSIEQEAQVAASSKNGSGTAGDVDITASTVTLNNGEITAETDAGGTGNPANITLRNLNSLNLSNNSSISASTQTGQAGSVTINDEENPAASVTLNNSSISAQATGDGGNAGDVTINAETLFLNNGKITAETRGNGQGANITLNLTDWLRLENESLISAEAFGDADGGNVTINLTTNRGFLFALPSNSNGSDIIAKAAGGTGGNITITAPLGIYGIEERKAIDGNRTNDIDASSEFGAPGQITINSLVIDPSQGLIELPTDTAAPQLDQTCSPTGSGNNEFTVTGRDGLPPSPTDILTPEQPLADLGTPINSTTTQPTPTPTPPASPKSIVEAQGWIIDEQGNITLVANVPTANSQGAWQPQVSCQGGR